MAGSPVRDLGKSASPVMRASCHAGRAVPPADNRRVMLAGMSAPPADRNEPLGAIIARMAAAQKSNRNAPGYSRWVNRPIGRVFGAVAFKAGLTPNAVTGVSALFTFSAIAGIALLPPTPASGLACALGLVIGYALDSADGQLARLRGGGSPAGEWLDHVVDCFKVTTFHLAIAIMWFLRWTPGPLPIGSVLVPLAFSVESGVWFFTIILTDLLLRARGVRADFRADGEERSSWLTSLLALPADYGLLCVLIALIGWPVVFVPVYAALAAANIVLLALQMGRWYRRVAAS